MNDRRVNILGWTAVLLAGVAISANTTGDVGLLFGSMVSLLGGFALSTYRPV